MSNKFLEALNKFASRYNKNINFDKAEQMISELENGVGDSSAEDKGTLKTVIKQFKEDERISVEILAEPNFPDAHGEFYSEETVLNGYQSFDKALKEGRAKPNIFHLKDDDGSNLQIVNHYVMPCDCIIGETPVVKGTWIMEMKWLNESLWKKRTVPLEDGTYEIAGLSLRGWGRKIPPEQKEGFTND